MLDGIEKVVIGKELDKEDILFSEELWKADLPGKFRGFLKKCTHIYLNYMEIVCFQY